MIVAARFGWAAVRGPDRMSFVEFLLALQLLAEESFGTPGRRAVIAAKEREDAAFDAALAAIREGAPAA